MQAITDGTSNTGLFSERLIAGYPLNTTGATVYSNGISGLRAIFQGSYAAAPSSTVLGTLPQNGPAMLFAQGCQSIPSTTASLYPSAVGIEMIAGNPGFLTLASYTHWTAPNTVPCQNSIDVLNTYGYIGPYGAASPNSLHPGGVNVGFADGSVHFIKNSVNLVTWWGLGSRAGGEVISSDSY